MYRGKQMHAGSTCGCEKPNKKHMQNNFRPHMHHSWGTATRMFDSSFTAHKVWMCLSLTEEVNKRRWQHEDLHKVSSHWLKKKETNKKQTFNRCGCGYVTAYFFVPVSMVWHTHTLIRTKCPGYSLFFLLTLKKPLENKNLQKSNL